AEVRSAAAAANKGKAALASLLEEEEEEEGQEVFALVVPGLREDMLEGLEPDDVAACQRVLSHLHQRGAGVSTQRVKKQKHGAGASAQPAKKQKREAPGASAQGEGSGAASSGGDLPKGWNVRYAAILAKETEWADPNMTWPEKIKAAHKVIRRMDEASIRATVLPRFAQQDAEKASAGVGCTKCRMKGCARCMKALGPARESPCAHGHAGASAQSGQI
ncbi:MAG: hypothetical protein GY772_28245, partial [bacterium]|nr:hypothetical protein [bacterium]